MIEFKGWVTIESDSDELDVFELNKKIIADIDIISIDFKQKEFCEIKEINGSVNLFIGGGYNHDNGYSQDLLQLLEKICKVAPHTFGIIYVRWPEHEELWNQYKVYRIAKGEITIMDDVYLSPCLPIIEDDF